MKNSGVIKVIFVVLVVAAVISIANINFDLQMGKAWKYISNAEYSKAAEILDYQIENNGKQEKVYLLYADYYIALEEYQDALDVLNEGANKAQSTDKINAKISEINTLSETHQKEITKPTTNFGWWFCLIFSVGVVLILVSADYKARKEAEPTQEESQDAENLAEASNNNDNIEFTPKWQKPFGNWTKEQLLKKGQEDRYNKSIYDDIAIVSINKSAVTAEIRGTQGDVYDVTLDKCNCPDFKHRHLPCKHIYLLARNVKKSKGGLK